MKQPAVSVIIPVHNSAQYLSECLGNVVHQTLENIEIILIDDASTDDSRRILEDCEKQFPEKVLLIELDKNMGAGGARNFGIDAANGAYIGFVDSDDQIQPDMYEKLYCRALEEDYDIVDAGFYHEENDRAIIFTTDEMCGRLDDKKRSALIASGGYLCTKIIRRELFETPSGRLHQRGKAILEDSEMLNYMICNAKTMGNVKEILYIYRNRNASASKLSDLDRYFDEAFSAIEANYELLHGLPGYEGVRVAVEYEMLQYSYAINSCIKYVMTGRSPVVAEQRMKDLITLRKKVIPSGIDNPYVSEKIPKADIDLMRRAEKDPRALLKAFSK